MQAREKLASTDSSKQLIYTIKHDKEPKLATKPATAPHALPSSDEQFSSIPASPGVFVLRASW